MRQRKLGRPLLTVTLALVLMSSPAASAEKNLILGVHPFLPSTELVQKFAPLADYLSRELNHAVHVEISPDYEAHIQKVSDGSYDIAYMGPVSYVRLVERHARVPLLAKLEINGVPTFQGAILVRRDSPLKNLDELVGKSFAFVGPSSTMGFIVPRYVMKKKGVTVEKLAAHSFLNNHDNVALAVLVGDFDAGAVKEETFRKFSNQGARALAMTPPIPEHLLVASPRLSKDVVEGLRATLLRIAGTSDGQSSLQSIKATVTNLVPVADSDYDLLRVILSESRRDEISP